MSAEQITTPVRTALVVDDTPLVRHMLAIHLQHAGFSRIDLAADGEEALSLLQDHVPDVVFTDYHMPKMDGMALVSKIRASDTCGKVPVVVVTTESRVGVDWQLAGFTDYLHKPYTKDLIAETLDRVIGRCA